MRKPPYNPFPPVEEAGEDGLLAIGGDISPNLLLLAYLQGIFPWPFSEDHPLAWFSPDPRGVLFMEDLHIPKSLKRFLNNHKYEVRYNTDFTQVIDRCAQTPRVDQKGTWITQTLKESYIRLYEMDYAYSVEILKGTTMVAGLYGVCIDTIISGESMFYTEPNTSKLALVSLIKKLRAQGISQLDTQMVTPVTEQLGAREIPREDFIKMIKSNRKGMTRDQLFS